MSGPAKYGWDALALTIGAWRTWSSYRSLWPALFLPVGTWLQTLRRVAADRKRG